MSKLQYKSWGRKLNIKALMVDVLLGVEPLISNLDDGYWRGEAWTDQRTVILGKRHLILWLNDDNDACRITRLCNVLLLLNIHRHRQACTCQTKSQCLIFPFFFWPTCRATTTRTIDFDFRSTPLQSRALNKMRTHLKFYYLGSPWLIDWLIETLSGVVVSPEVDAGQFFWTRPDPHKFWPNPTRPAFWSWWVTRDPTRPGPRPVWQ